MKENLLKFLITVDFGVAFLLRLNTIYYSLLIDKLSNFLPRLEKKREKIDQRMKKLEKKIHYFLILAEKSEAESCSYKTYDYGKKCQVLKETLVNFEDAHLRTSECITYLNSLLETLEKAKTGLKENMEVNIVHFLAEIKEEKNVDKKATLKKQLKIYRNECLSKVSIKNFYLTKVCNIFENALSAFKVRRMNVNVKALIGIEVIQKRKDLPILIT